MKSLLCKLGLHRWRRHFPSYFGSCYFNHWRCSRADCTAERTELGL